MTLKRMKQDAELTRGIRRWAVVCREQGLLDTTYSTRGEARVARSGCDRVVPVIVKLAPRKK
jgi:hypothetical protein